MSIEINKKLKTILNCSKLNKKILLDSLKIISSEEYNNFKTKKNEDIKIKLFSLFESLNINTNDDYLNNKLELNKLHNFNEVKKWASLDTHLIYKHGSKEDNKKEKKWGNKMINQKNNNQWTTSLGEQFIYELLKKLNKNPRRPTKKQNYLPDWETDDAIYEVKTRNWTTTGTAGEKVYGTPLKYAEIYEIYNKPLFIVCVGYQEYEFINSNTPILGDKIRDSQKKILDFYEKEFKIKYIGCSELIQELNELETLNKLSNLKI